MARYKKLSRHATIRNLNGLSEGDKAYCGPFGTVTCYCAAKNSRTGKRMFKVEGSLRLANRGNWTMDSLRKAICSKRQKAVA